MASNNTFGSPSGPREVFHPGLARGTRRRFRRDRVPGLDLANGLYVPTGLWPARGWLLMRRSEYDQIDPYATDLELRPQDYLKVTPGLVFGGLTVVHARSITTGLAEDPDAIYLVEVTDARGRLFNRWSCRGVNAQYNVRAPAYPGEYYSGTLDGGTTPWTWDRMCQDLWSRMNELGSYPGLPSTPGGTPENWSFPGSPVWPGFCRILKFLGMTVACDLTVSSPYTVVDQGGSDASFTAATARYRRLLEDDAEWLDGGGGRVPGRVVCYFHRRNEQYGTEETVRRDTLQWQTSSLYEVSVTSPPPFDASPAIHHLWGDFTVRYDVDNSPLAADVAQAAVLAQQMVSDYFRDVFSATDGFMRRRYAGTVPFTTGSQVDGVCWRQDFRDRGGWVTEVVRCEEPPWPEVTW